MKRALSLLLAVLALVSLAGCGEAGPSREAQEVTRLIEAIGDVTLDSEGAIIAAEEAYAALSDEQKAEVEIADYLPIYRNNYEVLRHEADWEQLKGELVGDWYSITDEEDAVVSLHADGTAEIGRFSYTWTLNQNMETVRLEGESRIVFEVLRREDLFALNNPYLMTCLKEADYRDFCEKVFYTPASVESVLGEAVDVGPLLDAEGKETGTRLFAFHSIAYDEGLIYFRCSINFALDYSASSRFRGVLYEPFAAAPYTRGVRPENISVTSTSGTVTFIRSEYVESVSFDPETKERTITLKNGLTFSAGSGMNPHVDGVVYNVYDYLADPAFVF